MPVTKLKLTKKLDLNNTAEVCGIRFTTVNANCYVSPRASGTTFYVGKAAAEKVFFFLPSLRTATNAATNTGVYWNFVQTNAAPFALVAPANYIRHELAVNASHGFKSINTNCVYYAYCTILGADRWYYVWAPNVNNVSSFIQG